jgi:biopolymer transport protein ExbD
MAEIQAAPAARSGKPRVKKNAFRLDMTPMVDLAFLLLTFFMLTTTFNKPTVMQLHMPVKGKETPLQQSRVMTLILDKRSQVHYFFGLNSETDPTVAKTQLHTTDFGANGLRQALLQRQQQDPATVVLIKTTADAKYRDMVDALDEMNITNQQKYALVDLSPADRTLLQKHGF